MKKLIQRIYYLNIKSQRGRNWLGMFWFGVLMLLIIPFMENANSDGLLGAILIITVSYIFALLNE